MPDLLNKVNISCNPDPVQNSLVILTLTYVVSLSFFGSLYDDVIKLSHNAWLAAFSSVAKKTNASLCLQRPGSPCDLSWCILSVGRPGGV